MPAILLVDDEDNLLNIGKIYLEKNTGFPVTTLTSAQDALKFLADHTVDVIVSDYQMPVMDGIQFLKIIRARGDNTPFIIFTGKGREEVVIEALNSGADFYLQKGGEPKSQFVELANKIQHAVSRRQAEVSLVQKEAELHAILQGSPIPTFVIDRTHHVISWNRALEEITGIRVADVLGTTRHWKAFYDKERPCLADLLIDGKTGAIKDWYAGKCKKNFQIHGVYEATDFFPYLGKSGRWLHFTASLIRGESEQAIGAVETLQDITRRVEAEEALRTSEERYRSVVEDQTEFICRFTPDGRLTFVNDAYCRYFNLDKDSCLMQPHTVVLPPEDAHLMKQHLALLTPDNPVASIDHRIIMASGEIRWQRWSDRAIFDKDGQVIEYQSVGRDITERKRVEEALKESEERYRALFHGTAEGILVADTQTKRFIHANPAICRMLGYSYEELTSMGLEDLHTKEDLARVTGEFIAVARGEKSRTQEIPFLRKDGTIIYADITSSQVTIEGRKCSIGLFTDVTERKQVEEALRESEIRFRTILNQASDAIFVHDIHGRIIMVNQKACQSLGYTRDELLSMNISDIDPEATGAGINHMWQEIILGQNVSFESRHTRKDGTTFPIELTLGPIKLEKEVLVVGIVRDITNRRKAEKELQESEKQYRTLMEQVPELILVQRDGIIQYANPAVVKTLGYGSEEILNRPLTNIVRPEYHDRIATALCRRMSGETVEPYEVEVLGKTGGRRTVVVSGSRIEFKGAPASLIVLTDITERRIAEGALRQSEEQFRAIFHNQQTGLLMIDAATHLIIDVNKTALSLIGTGKEEVIGKVCHTYICPAERGRCPVTDLGQSVDNSERILINAKNERVPVLKSVNKIELGGKPYLIESFIDITERKALENAVVQANRKLHLLSSITRHDIQNQLLVLRGYIGMSRESLDDKKTLLGFFEKEDNATTIIGEQIRFTKEYQEMGVKESLWQNVHECIKNSVLGLDMRDIRIEVDRTDLEIFADPLFDKVFYNLMDNALRYGGRGMTAIRVSSHESAEGLILVWEDDGVGITEDDKKCLFSKGFGKNTGLGLFLVREILSITGITITENGTPAKVPGSKFQYQKGCTGLLVP